VWGISTNDMPLWDLKNSELYPWAPLLLLLGANAEEIQETWKIMKGGAFEAKLQAKRGASHQEWYGTWNNSKTFLLNTG